MCDARALAIGTTISLAICGILAALALAGGENALEPLLGIALTAVIGYSIAAAMWLMDGHRQRR